MSDRSTHIDAHLAIMGAALAYHLDNDVAATVRTEFVAEGVRQERVGLYLAFVNGTGTS